MPRGPYRIRASFRLISYFPLVFSELMVAGGFGVRQCAVSQQDRRAGGRLSWPRSSAIQGPTRQC